jgi:glutathione S-transferase
MMHTFWALAMTGKPTFPVLRLNGKAIGDSTRIIQELERRYPEPPLYPEAPAQRTRALELEDFFDEELGPYIRRYLFHEALEGLPPSEFINGAMGSTSGAVKRVMVATAPVGKGMLKLRYKIDSEGAEHARAKTVAAMERLDAEIQPSGYLVGDSFTVADLTAASLFFPVVRPPEAPHRIEAEIPPNIARLTEQLSQHRGWNWVEEMYRKHRGVSAAIAA